jgi:DNA-binding MltR family transcriptional regulator
MFVELDHEDLHAILTSVEYSSANLKEKAGREPMEVLPETIARLESALAKLRRHDAQEISMGRKQPNRQRRLIELERQLELAEQMSLESDRGSVLLGAGAIDDATGRLLEFFFEKAGSSNDEREMELQAKFFLEGPMANFAVRVRACYMLGLINKSLYQQLEGLRAVRNPFAHLGQSVELTAADVRRITAPKKWGSDLLQFHETTQVRCDAILPRSDTKSFSDARRMFTTAATLIFASVIIRGWCIHENVALGELDLEAIPVLPPP